MLCPNITLQWIMAKKPTMIYSPEQIASRMRQIQAENMIVQAPPPIVVNRIENEEMKNQVNSLEERLKEVKSLITTRGRRSPTELRAALGDLFDAYDFSPAEELVRMVMEKNEDGRFVLEPGLRTKILSELQSYVMPKLSATKVEGHVDHSHTVLVVRYGDDGKVSQEPMKAANAVVTASGVGKLQEPLDIKSEVMTDEQIVQKVMEKEKNGRNSPTV